jgi:purine catabolism regulator
MTIKDLMDSKFFTGATLEAGEKNIHNSIHSVTVLDSPDGVNFLKGGELILTTGYCLKNGEALQMNIIQKLAENGAAALGMTLRYFNNELPMSIKDTANRVGLPIIILPDGFAYVEIHEFINSFKSRWLQKGFKEINNSLYVDGLSGLAETLHKYTGLAVVVMFGDSKYVAPTDFHIPDYLLDKKLWFVKKNSGIKSQDVEAFTREVAGDKKEWLSAEIRTPDTEGGRIILIKGEKAFAFEEERMLDYAASVCALEVNFIKSLISIQRKHKKKFLESLFSGDFTRDEAVSQAKKLNYHIPKEGVVIVLSMDTEAGLIDEERLEFHGKSIFGPKVVQGLMESKYYVLFPEYSLENLDSVDRMVTDISKELGDISITIGIGRSGAYEKITESYHEAKGAIRIGSCCELDTSVFEFNNLGFYRLLMSNELDKEMDRFYEDYLKPLEINDAEHNSNLIETLKCLIHSNYKHRVAAAEMFVHPNTIRYRIKIIEKLCRINLDLPDNRLLMEIAIKILPLIEKDNRQDRC